MESLDPGAGEHLVAVYELDVSAASPQTAARFVEPHDGLATRLWDQSEELTDVRLE